MCRARILSDDTELYYTVFGYGESVRVTAEDEESCTLYLGDGVYSKLPRWMIRTGTDVEYEAWTGYIRSDSVIYKDNGMSSVLAELGVNDEVTVLEAFDTYYVVDVNGQKGYVELDSVSEDMIDTSYYGGGDGGGGGEWTAPVL